MRQLVLGAVLIGGVWSSASCISLADDSKEGRFEVAWVVTVDGEEMDCRDTDARFVILIATAAGTQEVVEDVFDCPDGGDISSLLVEDSYSVVVEVRARGDEPQTAELLASTEARTEAILDGHVTDLGVLTFELEPPP